MSADYGPPIPVGPQIQLASPCGTDCTSVIDGHIPGLSCDPGLTVGLIHRAYITGNVYNMDYATFSNLDFQYLASNYIYNRTIDGKTNRTLRFDVAFGDPDYAVSYTCVVYSHNVRLELSYDTNGDSVKALSKSSKLFNASILVDPHYTKTYVDTGIQSIEPFGYTLPSNFDCLAHSLNCATLSDLSIFMNIFQGLTGWQSADPSTDNGLPIGTCAGASLSINAVPAEYYENIIRNANLLEFLHVGLQGSALVNATSTTFANTYQFRKPMNFYLPYAMSLGVSANLIGLSIIILLDNGYSADMSFSRMLCITSPLHPRIRALALRGADSKATHKPVELLEERIRFGVVHCEDDVDRVGLGSAEDVIPLEKVKRRPWLKVPRLRRETAMTSDSGCLQTRRG